MSAFSFLCCCKCKHSYSLQNKLKKIPTYLISRNSIVSTPELTYQVTVSSLFCGFPQIHWDFQFSLYTQSLLTRKPYYKIKKLHMDIFQLFHLLIYLGRQSLLSYASENYYYNMGWNAILMLMSKSVEYTWSYNTHTQNCVHFENK